MYMNTIEGHLSASGMKMAIVAARWNDFIGSRLVEGAVDCFIRHGGKDEHLTLVRCPGSFELPMVLKKVAATKKYDAIVAIGVLIKGATDHYDLIAAEATKGIAQVSMESGIPIAFGVLTTDSIEQAIERAGTKAGNKGWDAMAAAIEEVDLFKKIG
ncbi:MAG: 6,7-dimethyl-8-ribityllumazine synthase [Chloroherpetonaceae bacterium]|nr:6,7-dimethyl-8-ribityllumazine synthase [Chloroherpetonaceae bacterium]